MKYISLLLFAVAMLCVGIIACAPASRAAQRTPGAGTPAVAANTSQNTAAQSANAPAQSANPPSQNVSTGDAAAGKTLFEASCGSCHGKEAKGLPGLGKDLTTSAFVHDRNDTAMVTFLKTGRPAGDPLNTTGVDMPPKGGNPALTDTNLLDIIAFVRSLAP